MALTGIIQRRDLKLVLTGTPPIEGEIVYATDTDEFGWLASNGVNIIWTNFETPNSIDWGNLTGDIQLQLDLKAALDDKANLIHGHDIADVQDLTSELNNRYLKTEHIQVSNGAGDANKPVITNANGLLDNSMIASAKFTLLGNWTPTNGAKYPSVIGLITGDFYHISGVDANNGYLYLTGDLITQTIFNGDQLTWSTNGWIIVQGNVNPDAYLRLDGTTVMINDLDVGNNFINLIKDGVLPTDGVSKLQMETADSLKSTIGHIHNGTGGELAYEVADVAIQAHISSTNVNPHTTSFSQLLETPTTYAGKKGQRVTVNDTEDGIIFEPSSGSGMFSGEFIFDGSSNTVPNPSELADGQLRQNNTNSSLVTDIWVSKTDKFGTDRTYGLSLLRTSDFFGMVDSVTGSFALYTLTSAPIDNGGTDNFLTFQVDYKTDSGIPFVEGASIVGEIAINGAKIFTDLQDGPSDYVGTANQFLKVTEGDLTDGDGIELKALEINDIGFDFAGNGSAISTLQAELDSKLGGLGKTAATILEPLTPLLTTSNSVVGPGSNQNIIKYNYTGTGNIPSKFDKKSSITIGTVGETLNILGTIFQPLVLKNNVGLQAWDSSYDDGLIKNLISRSDSGSNVGIPSGIYNSEVVVGDSDIKTVLRESTNSFRPAVRTGSSGTTTDYTIHTEQDFLVAEFKTTETLAVTNETGLTTINTYVGIDDTSGLSLKIKTSEDNIGVIGDLATTANDLVAAVNEVKTSSDNHSSIIIGNPHNVTKTEIGLSNANNTSDLNKPISTATTAALALKWDGLAVTGNMDIDKTISFRTEGSVENILSYADSTSQLGITDGKPIFTLGEADSGLIFDGRIINPLILQNSIGLQSVKNDGSAPVNLISRSDSALNTGAPALYNDDITIGADGVLTVIRDSIGFETVIRSGADNFTIDYKIYSERDFDITNYTTTGADANYEPANSNIQSHISATNNPHGTTLSNLGETTIVTPADGEVLTYDGSDWKNTSLPQAIAVADIVIDGSESAAGNAAKINELLTSLRIAGLLAV